MTEEYHSVLITFPNKRSSTFKCHISQLAQHDSVPIMNKLSFFMLNLSCDILYITLKMDEI